MKIIKDYGLGEDGLIAWLEVYKPVHSEEEHEQLSKEIEEIESKRERNQVKRKK